MNRRHFLLSPLALAAAPAAAPEPRRSVTIHIRPGRGPYTEAEVRELLARINAMTKHPKDRA